MKRIVWTLFPVMALTLAAAGDNAAAGDKGHEHGQAFAACAKACADCSNSCASCYHHCVGLLAAGKKEHARTMILCNDCAEVCSTAAKLSARQSPFSAMVCETCAKTCDECGAACAKFSDDRHMSDWRRRARRARPRAGR